MGNPFTEDTLSTVMLYGRNYSPGEDGIIRIPLKDAEATVELKTEGLKRKDWYYLTQLRGRRHLSVAFSSLMEQLNILIKKEELA